MFNRSQHKIQNINNLALNNLNQLNKKKIIKKANIDLSNKTTGYHSSFPLTLTYELDDNNLKYKTDKIPCIVYASGYQDFNLKELPTVTVNLVLSDPNLVPTFPTQHFEYWDSTPPEYTIIDVVTGDTVQGFADSVTTAKGSLIYGDYRTVKLSGVTISQTLPIGIYSNYIARTQDRLVQAGSAGYYSTQTLNYVDNSEMYSTSVLASPAFWWEKISSSIYRLNYDISFDAYITGIATQQIWDLVDNDTLTQTHRYDKEVTINETTLYYYESFFGKNEVLVIDSPLEITHIYDNIAEVWRPANQSTGIILFRGVPTPYLSGQAICLDGYNITFTAANWAGDYTINRVALQVRFADYQTVYQDTSDQSIIGYYSLQKNYYSIDGIDPYDVNNTKEATVEVKS